MVGNALLLAPVVEPALSRRYLAGGWRLFEFALKSEAGGLRLDVSQRGDYELPYRSGTVELMGMDRWALDIRGDGLVEWGKAG